MNMTITLIGSVNYDSFRVIKDTIFKLKNQFGSDLLIVGGGNTIGADRFIKKYTLEFDIDYIEFPPFNCPYTSYCPLPQGRYNKPFTTKNIFARNKFLIKNTAGVIIFNNEETIPATITDVIKKCDKIGLPYKIII